MWGFFCGYIWHGMMREMSAHKKNNAVELTQGLIDKLDWNMSQEEFDLTVEYFNNSEKGF